VTEFKQSQTLHEVSHDSAAKLCEKDGAELPSVESISQIRELMARDDTFLWRGPEKIVFLKRTEIPLKVRNRENGGGLSIFTIGGGGYPVEM